MPLSYKLKQLCHINSKMNSLQIYDIDKNHRILHKVVQHLSQHNLTILKCRHTQKAPSKKIMIVIKRVGMSMIFQCTKLNLPKSNG
jgi:hypothetical protein